ncbi:MAG TPA: hypothetical protein VFW41_02485 [Gaiellaceae bacterium]|nr:hypothetical protein [Gaiellaceae bacterium]
MVTAPPRPPVLPDPEALIEEARRRARRRRAWYVAAAVLALGGAAGLFFGGGGGRSPGSGRAASHGPRPLTRAQELHALERAGRRATIVAAGVDRAGVGWAMNGLGMWATSDGGAHWWTATPAVPGGDVVARVGQVYFLNAKVGWASGVDLIGTVFYGDASDRFSAIERTTDGGRTWHMSAHNCAACGGSLSFLDAKRGFALTGLQPSPRLFRTGDGGVTWSRVARAPFTGSIEFRDLRNGWGATWSGRLFRTTDGGRHWERLPFAASSGLPRFFGTAGVVASHRVIEVTRDGGRTWSAVAAPADAVQFSAPTARDWYVWSGKTLWRTSDAGGRWSKVAMRVVPQNLSDLTFTSPRTAWAIFTLGGDAIALAKTTNGGRDWLPLTPPVPKPPRS